MPVQGGRAPVNGPLDVAINNFGSLSGHQGRTSGNFFGKGSEVKKKSNEELGGWNKKLTFPPQNLVSFETSQICRLGEAGRGCPAVAPARCCPPLPGCAVTRRAAALAVPPQESRAAVTPRGDTSALGTGGSQGTTKHIPILAMWHGASWWPGAVEGGGRAGGWLPPAACSACSAC